METESTVTILLVHDNVDEANRMVSLLRNANYQVDPHYAANAGELNRKIQERNWDLVLAQYSAQSIPAKNIIHQIRRSNKDIPVIFMISDFNAEEMVDALKIGASDTVPEDQDQYFIQAVGRTLYNLEQRRKLRYWKRRFSESEDRFESLILSSQDGIAIIKEGTYVHVNDAFARFFGFPDGESMILLPVFDTIADGSQGAFKKYLKPLDEHQAWDTEVITFDGVQPDSTALPVQATLSQIDFHGEQALQLLIKKNFIQSTDGTREATPTRPATMEADVSKIRLHEMVEGINGAIRRAAKNSDDALLLYLQMDQYDQVQKSLGIGKTEEGITQLAKFLDSMIAEKVVFGRIREDAFILVLATSDTEKGLSFGNKLVQEVSSRFFNTSAGSFNCTLSVGITLIGEATASADEALSACQKAISELHQSGKPGNGVKLNEHVFDFRAGEASDEDILRMGRQLIKKNQVMVAFQPVISLHGLKDEFYEVLMRPAADAFAEGEIPADFIAKVFKTDIGEELDKLVISQALRKLAEKKLTSPQVKLCIHLSRATIEDEKFVPWLQKAIDAHSLPPGDLVLQMREIDIGRHLQKATTMLERLRNIGTGTGITHFGVSINPMTIFSRISVDYVKIDGMLSDKAQKDKNALTSLKSLLAELKSPKRKLVVPYIESATIIPSLWQAGVDFLQGYYIQPPQAEMNFDFSQE